MIQHAQAEGYNCYTKCDKKKSEVGACPNVTDNSCAQCLYYHGTIPKIPEYIKNPDKDKPMPNSLSMIRILADFQTNELDDKEPQLSKQYWRQCVTKPIGPNGCTKFQGANGEGSMCLCQGNFCNNSIFITISMFAVAIVSVMGFVF